MNKNKIIPELRFPEFRNGGEWESKKLGEVAEFLKGKSISKADICDNGQIACIRYGELYTIYNEVINEVVSFTDLPQETLVFSKANDVIIPASGETQIDIAKASCVKLNNIALGGDLNIIRSSANGIFLSYYLNHPLKYNIAKLAQGNAVVHLYNNQLKSLSLHIPKNPLEQQKIADCLSSLDEVIAGHEEKLLTLQDHKRGLMQNLFPQEGETKPKYRFPEFEDDGDWEENALIDTADKNIKWSFIGGPFGSNLKASDYTNEGIRIIQLQNIGDGAFNGSYKIYTSLEKANELLSCNIYSGDIILSKMGDPVGRACIMPGEDERFLMASDGIRLVVNEKEYSKYLIFSLINSDTVRSKIENNSTGSTRKRIGLSILKQIPLLLPKTKEEQTKIADCLSSIDNLIEAEATRIEQLKQHKQGLMQGLFPKVEE